jgi:hypothetical protein
MKRIYFCPYCGATLNPSVKVILSAATPRGSGLILLSPQPGNYVAIGADELALQQGDLVEFRCPVCRAGLTSRVNAKFAEIGFRMTNGVEGRVDFSRRYGEHATFFVTHEEVRSYGEDAGTYAGFNFFGAGQPDTGNEPE